MGWETLLNPLVGGEAATTFVVADDAEAKATVIQLAEALGLDAVDAGPLANAASVEALARLWVAMSRGYGRDIAFRLLRRE